MPFWAEELTHQADWIWHRDPANVATRADTALFFHAPLIPPTAATLELFVSASGRYALHIDTGTGPQLAGRGPARNDRLHTSLDPFGITLQPNQKLHLWLIARAMIGMPEAPMSEMHPSTAALMGVGVFRNAAGEIVARFGTNDKTENPWRACAIPRGLLSIPMRDPNQFFGIGFLEHHHAAHWPTDWLSDRAPTSSGWHHARRLSHIYFTGDQRIPYGGDFFPWMNPREIAMPDETPTPFFTAYDFPAVTPLAANQPITIAPHTTRSFLFDAGASDIGYPRLTLVGKNATAALNYAEVLYDSPALPDKPRDKSFNPHPGSRFESFIGDNLSLGERERFTFEPFHWRSFRFIKIDITAGDTPAKLETFDYLHTGYPFESAYAFSAEGPHADTIQKIGDVSWRTLKCCTWETYMDCPYYEQLQYIGDARIQVLLTYICTGDLELPAQALRAFDRSRIAEGITQSRYPCVDTQLIPTFSLIYILMIHDYWQYAGDDALVAELRPGIATVLNFWGRLLDPITGLVTMSPYWNFTDWVDGWYAGSPPGPISSIINLQYLLALQAAAEIYDASRSGSGEHFAARATQLKQRIFDTFFDARLGLIRDLPKDGNASPLSQHAQALAVLAGVLKSDQGRHAMKTALLGSLNDQKIDLASFYFRFYIAEALAKLKMGDHLWDVLAPFREAIGNGSTTWPESLGPTARSECHAWGSWPLYFFLRHILGVSPPRSTDGIIVIDPLHVPPLGNVRGTALTYRGPVHVSVDWLDNKPTVTVDGPPYEVRAS
jgi:alpha-L-rhamnosidase